MIFDFKSITFVLFIAIFQYFLTYFLIKKSLNNNIFLAIPNSRSSHIEIVPRSGGIALYVGFILYSFVFLDELYDVYYFFLTGIFLLGLFDDYRPLNFKIKLSFQLLFTIFLSYQFFSIFDYEFYILILFGVFLINVINFMDGADGYISIHSILFSINYIFYYYYYGFQNNLLINIIFIIIFINLIFLLFNFHPAKIFLGDSGSYFQASLLLLLLYESYKIDLNFFLIINLSLFPYFFDSIITIFRRLKNNKNIFTAHREHIYQIILCDNHNKLIYKFILYYTFNCFLIFITIYFFENIFYSVLSTSLLNIILYYKILKNYKSELL